jgi:uncharacterized membrane protein YgcG
MTVKKNLILLAAALCAIFFAGTVVFSADSVYPKKIDEYVNDFAGILKNTDKISIAELLRKIDYDQGAEVQVVCVNSVNDYFPGAGIEEFASGIFKEWNVGSKAGKGMVLLIAINDRRIAIDLGGAKPGIYGVFMKKVVNGKIIPHFKDGDYSRGIYEGVREISRVMEARKSFLSSPLLPAAAIMAILAIAVFFIMKRPRSGPGPENTVTDKETPKAQPPPQSPGFGGGSAGNW